MKPEWRTETVVQMCQVIRKTGDYSALPVLADALQEADCTDEELLSNLRRYLPVEKGELYQRLRLLALIESEETAAAVERIDEIAAQFEFESSEGNYTYRDMIKLGYYAIDEKVGGMYFNTTRGPEYFWDEGNRKDFFNNWSLITGIEVSDEKQENMSFRCGC